MSFEPLYARLSARASRREGQLSDAQARQALATSDGPVDLALAFERALGGVVIEGHTLGLGTHARHPPRDAHDEWLDRDFQREMIQIAFGGTYGSTYWLDRRGWVHAIGPLDRLRAHSESLEAFVRFLLHERTDATHHAVIALSPCAAEDADAILGSRSGCPVGDGIVRLEDDALDSLEERAWIAREVPAPRVVLSARDLDRLLAPLATYLELEPDTALVLVDGDPLPAYADPLVDVVRAHRFRVPWQEAGFDLAIGRDSNGAFHAVRR